MKNTRQRKILEIIEKYNIEKQEELVEKLNQCGFNVTQATVSRDIREMNIKKGVGENRKTKYIVPDSITIEPNTKYMRVLKDGILSTKTSKNILVIKTVAGMAMAVGAAIDAIKLQAILGCIAGDDTIICVIDENVDAGDVKKSIDELVN